MAIGHQLVGPELNQTSPEKSRHLIATCSTTTPLGIPKRSPFSTIQNHAFLHSVEVIIPKDSYSKIKPALAKLDKPRYARVYMAPSSLLEHEFFNTYIKSGNILMISEGRSGSDNVFTLRDVVELNLRLPSMLHGKKGFDRIVWAFSHVLTQSVAWLFYDLEDPSSLEEPGPKPIHRLQPQLVTCELQETGHEQVIMPRLYGDTLDSMPEGELQEYCGELAEWLAMVQMGSPRAQEDDIDPYLSRYAISDAQESRVDLLSLKWHGLISCHLAMKVFLLAKHSPWFAVAAAGLGKDAVEGRDGFTVLAEGAKVICWETTGASIVALVYPDFTMNAAIPPRSDSPEADFYEDADDRLMRKLILLFLNDQWDGIGPISNLLTGDDGKIQPLKSDLFVDTYGNKSHQEQVILDSIFDSQSSMDGAKEQQKIPGIIYRSATYDPSDPVLGPATLDCLDAVSSTAIARHSIPPKEFSEPATVYPLDTLVSLRNVNLAPRPSYERDNNVFPPKATAHRPSGSSNVTADSVRLSDSLSQSSVAVSGSVATNSSGNQESSVTSATTVEASNPLTLATSVATASDVESAPLTATGPTAARVFTSPNVNSQGPTGKQPPEQEKKPKRTPKKLQQGAQSTPKKKATPNSTPCKGRSKAQKSSPATSVDQPPSTLRRLAPVPVTDVSNDTQFPIQEMGAPAPNTPFQMTGPLAPTRNPYETPCQVKQRYESPAQSTTVTPGQTMVHDSVPIPQWNWAAQRTPKGVKQQALPPTPESQPHGRVVPLGKYKFIEVMPDDPSVKRLQEGYESKQSAASLEYKSQSIPTNPLSPEGKATLQASTHANRAKNMGKVIAKINNQTAIFQGEAQRLRERFELLQRSNYPQSSPEHLKLAQEWGLLRENCAINEARKAQILKFGPQLSVMQNPQVVSNSQAALQSQQIPQLQTVSQPQGAPQRQATPVQMTSQSQRVPQPQGTPQAQTPPQGQVLVQSQASHPYGTPQRQATPQLQSVPQSQGTPQCQAAPIQMTPQSQRVPQPQGTTQHHAPPKFQVLVQSQVSQPYGTPQRQATSQLQRVPQMQGVPLPQALPQFQASPQLQRAPQLQGIPQGQATPRLQDVPQSHTGIPSTGAAHIQGTPNSQLQGYHPIQVPTVTLGTPQFQVVAQSQYAPQLQGASPHQSQGPGQYIAAAQYAPQVQVSPRFNTAVRPQGTPNSQGARQPQCSPRYPVAPRSQATPLFQVAVASNHPSCKQPQTAPGAHAIQNNNYILQHTSRAQPVAPLLSTASLKRRFSAMSSNAPNDNLMRNSSPNCHVLTSDCASVGSSASLNGGQAKRFRWALD
ncbi:unnamed protein product [Penicillium olsonii]|nr:unnamed protein product [Penicillium olsonii]